MNDMETRVCITCKQELPSTPDYFYRRVIKQKLVDGSIAEYHTIRSQCKKCHIKKCDERRIVKRCAEMGCDIKDYRDNWKKQYSRTRTKYPEIKHLPKSVQYTLKKWLDDGYKFITYEQYRIDVRKKTSKASRKYDYGTDEFLTQKQRNGMAEKVITKSRVSLRFGIPTKDLPDEIYETAKLNIQIKRALKKGESEL